MVFGMYLTNKKQKRKEKSCPSTRSPTPEPPPSPPAHPFSPPKKSHLGQTCLCKRQTTSGEIGF